LKATKRVLHKQFSNSPTAHSNLDKSQLFETPKTFSFKHEGTDPLTKTKQKDPLAQIKVNNGTKNLCILKTKLKKKKPKNNIFSTVATNFSIIKPLKINRNCPKM
jgi:hypothetical protein